VFAGSSSSYEEGIDFVAKVAKLLVIGLGTGTTVDGVSEGTKDVLRFMNFVTPYFNPSNLGSWTFTLGAFLHYFSYEVSCRMGVAGSMNSIRENLPELAKVLGEVEPSLTVADIPPHEVALLMDALLPLCQQSLYSKNAMLDVPVRPPWFTLHKSIHTESLPFLLTLPCGHWVYQP